ncbi:hypothetical protein H8356DRAFT_1359037 [Neocallimastix lanati (nom. inval.)]|nr:hypothetical protein H8356DRAFT_1359037 [Neocallimastix sp. JGI-2020a]
MAVRRRNQEQVINLTGEDITHNGITFNYSKNFNQIIKLNTKNYPCWRRKILYLLKLNKLIKYVLHPVDQFDSSLVYQKNIKNIKVTNDFTAKWIIINGFGEETQKLINGNEKTAFQNCNIFRESFNKSKGRRKIEIQNKIETMKFYYNYVNLRSSVVYVNIFCKNKSFKSQYTSDPNSYDITKKEHVLGNFIVVESHDVLAYSYIQNNDIQQNHNEGVIAYAQVINEIMSLRFFSHLGSDGECTLECNGNLSVPILKGHLE